jgi:hypothetical protein
MAIVNILTKLKKPRTSISEGKRLFCSKIKSQNKTRKRTDIKVYKIKVFSIFGYIPRFKSRFLGRKVINNSDARGPNTIKNIT